MCLNFQTPHINVSENMPKHSLKIQLQSHFHNYTFLPPTQLDLEIFHAAKKAIRKDLQFNWVHKKNDNSRLCKKFVRKILIVLCSTNAENLSKWILCWKKKFTIQLERRQIEMGRLKIIWGKCKHCNGNCHHFIRLFDTLWILNILWGSCHMNFHLSDWQRSHSWDYCLTVYIRLELITVPIIIKFSKKHNFSCS